MYNSGQLVADILIWPPSMGHAGSAFTGVVYIIGSELRLLASSMSHIVRC